MTAYNPLEHSENSARGFTLIELLVVISIIGVLSSVILASLNNARKKAYDAQVNLQIEQIKNAFFLARDPVTGLLPEDPIVKGDYVCLKTSGTCMSGYGSPASPTVVASLQPYMSSIPKPPDPPFRNGTVLYDSYAVIINLTGVSGWTPGTYIVHGQTKPFVGCAHSIDWDIGTYGLYYCVELIDKL